MSFVQFMQPFGFSLFCFFKKWNSCINYVSTLLRVRAVMLRSSMAAHEQKMEHSFKDQGNLFKIGQTFVKTHI